LAEAPVAFEFNPAAPEFVPQPQQQCDLPPGLVPVPPLRRCQLSSDLVSTSCGFDHPRADVSTPGGANVELASPNRASQDKRAAALFGPLSSNPSCWQPSLWQSSVPEATCENAENSRCPTIRRATHATKAQGQVATLVVKNLAVDAGKSDIIKHLEDQCIAPTDVELHLDSNGVFRGTAFVRYESPSKAREAMQKLGACPEIGGRKARVEIQKSKTLFGRKSLEAELPREELGIVCEAIQRFVKNADQTEVQLPVSFSVLQRKYAHSLAEHHNLVHATRQCDNGDKYVHLSKARHSMESRHKSLCVPQSAPPKSSAALAWLFSTSIDSQCMPASSSSRRTGRRKAHSIQVDDELSSATCPHDQNTICSFKRTPGLLLPDWSSTIIHPPATALLPRQDGTMSSTKVLPMSVRPAPGLEL